MAKFKCKMCGAPLNILNGETVVVCEFCNSKQTVATDDDERKENLFNRANSLRANCDFDKAILSYQSILSLFPTEAEAHFGLCLCKYGIEYVDDAKTHKKIPTIHRMSYESILKDSDYLEALKYADVVAKEEYEAEAKEIANIQTNILSISQKEDPFDIFICYKETDDVGKRTRDSVMAQEIYTTLTSKGYKVFFSRVTLEQKLGTMYEPYIFAALNSAKVMLVIGSKKEYFESTWVKNEWSRFLDLMKTRPDHYLIPCYRDIDAYEMPEEFLSLQGQDMNKLGFMQDLIRGIDKIFGKNTTPNVQASTQTKSNVNYLARLKRAEILIKDEEFDKAYNLLEDVLNNDPENGKAYLLELLIDFNATSLEDLSNNLENTTELESNNNFINAYTYGDSNIKNDLDSLVKSIKDKIEENRLNTIYKRALELKNQKNYSEAINQFNSIIDYKDSKNQIDECNEIILKDKYDTAVVLKNNKNYVRAKECFTNIIDYKDSKKQIEECNELILKVKYDEGVLLKRAKNYDKAKILFSGIKEFRDSEFQISECDRLKDKESKELIYKSCQIETIIPTYTCVDNLKKACEKLAKIEDYKNSKELIVKYENLIEQLNKRIKDNIAKSKARKKRKKKIVIISSSTTIALITILLLVFLLIIPAIRTNKAKKAIFDFGRYPQSKVSDTTTISTLNSMAGTLPNESNTYKWTDYGYYLEGSISSYMYYIDIDEDSNGDYDYRGVYFTSYRPLYTSTSSTNYQSSNGYSLDTVYWFKYEPIKWNILKIKNNKALIISDLVLDSQDYNDSTSYRRYVTDYQGNSDKGTIYSNNYKYSHIRSWLNTTFYDTAFTTLEKEIIEITEVDNSASSTSNSSNSYACSNTNDKIFLLSYKEAKTYYSSNSARCAQGSDYAKSQGLYVSTLSSTSGNSYYWLRSPYYYSINDAFNVGGGIYSSNVYITYIGVRAACWINL
jgi:hypothetical protein